MNLLAPKTEEEWRSFHKFSSYTFAVLFIVISLIEGLLQTNFLIVSVAVLYLATLAIIHFLNRKWIIKRKGKKSFYFLMLMLFVAGVVFLFLNFTFR